MKIILEIVDGPEKGRVVTLKTGDRCTFGRVQGEVKLPRDRLVSGKHFQALNDGQQLLITDLNSRNHVYVDGAQIETNMPVAVSDGSSIVAGRKTKFLVKYEQSTINEPRTIVEGLGVGTTPEDLTSIESRENLDQRQRQRENRMPQDADSLDQARRPGHELNALESSKFLQHDSAKPTSVDAAESQAFVAAGVFDWSDEKSSKQGTRGETVPGSGQGVSGTRFGKREATPIVQRKKESNFTDSFLAPIYGHEQATKARVSEMPASKSRSSVSPVVAPPRYSSQRLDNHIHVYSGDCLPANSTETVADLLERLASRQALVFAMHPAKASSELSDPLSLAAPLFYWLPDAIARETAPVLVDGSQVSDLRHIAASWNQQSLVTFCGESAVEMQRHLLQLIRMDLQTGHASENILGLCWPCLLAPLLEHATAKSADFVFADAINAILMEDSSSPTWKIYSRNSMETQLQQLGFIKHAG
jgi:hypothetical protein